MFDFNAPEEKVQEFLILLASLSMENFLFISVGTALK
jgi:hypothetical protein